MSTLDELGQLVGVALDEHDRSGSTVTVAISKPAAGVPVMTGLTGSVRVWRSEKTGMRHVAAAA